MTLYDDCVKRYVGRRVMIERYGEMKFGVIMDLDAVGCSRITLDDGDSVGYHCRYVELLDEQPNDQPLPLP